MGKHRDKAPEFEGKVKRWGMSFFRRNHWRIASMYDTEDMEQEVFAVYWSVKFRHPRVVDEGQFMKLFKARLRGVMKTRSAACFPNTYNFGKDSGCVSLTSETGSDLTEGLVSAVCMSGSDLEVCLDLADQLPSDLKEVFMALVREAAGIEAIPFRWRRRLSGKNTPEPINKSLARMLGLSKDRDLFAEVSLAITNIGLED